MARLSKRMKPSSSYSDVSDAKKRYISKRTHDVGNSAEGLVLDEIRSFVLALGKVDRDELKGYALLVENDSNTTSAGGKVESVKLENHFSS